MGERTKYLKEMGETLWKLKDTLSELSASNELLGKVIEKQDDRIRQLEAKIVDIRADLRVNASTVELAAVKGAIEATTNLVSSVHGPMVRQIAELETLVKKIDGDQNTKTIGRSIDSHSQIDGSARKEGEL